jgi:hypothetical protein
MVAGRLIYQDSYTNLIPHFTKIGFPCPRNHNPADFLMSIMHAENKANLANYQLYFDSYS